MFPDDIYVIAVHEDGFEVQSVGLVYNGSHYILTFTPSFQGKYHLELSIDWSGCRALLSLPTDYWQSTRPWRSNQTKPFLITQLARPTLSKIKLAISPITIGNNEASLHVCSGSMVVYASGTYLAIHKSRNYNELQTFKEDIIRYSKLNTSNCSGGLSGTLPEDYFWWHPKSCTVTVYSPLKFLQASERKGPLTIHILGDSVMRSTFWTLGQIINPSDLCILQACFEIQL